MKYLKLIILALLCVSCNENAVKIEASLPATLKNGVITLETPKREAGQVTA